VTEAEIDHILCCGREPMGRGVEAKLLRELGKIAGIGGIALGVLLLVFQDVLKQSIGLPPDRAFAIVFALLIMTFGISGIGIIAWLVAKSMRPKTPVANGPLYLLGVLVALIAVCAVWLGVRDPQTAALQSAAFQGAASQTASNQPAGSKVFSPCQGRVEAVLAAVGEDVKIDQPLFTMDCPDVIKAEAAIVAAADRLEQANTHLSIVNGQYAGGIVSDDKRQKAISDQRNAEDGLKAERASTHAQFPMLDKDIDELVTKHSFDQKVTVRSPVNGRVVARNVAPGAFVHSDSATAQFIVLETDRVSGN
jgi:multidrug efflux pump subunit AcrA (membrane-fusion protein)